MKKNLTLGVIMFISTFIVAQNLELFTNFPFKTFGNVFSESNFVSKDKFYMGFIGGPIWISDGTLAGTKELKTNKGTINVNTNSFKELNGIVYFLEQKAYGTNIWRTDGTYDGTFIVQEYNSSTPPYKYINDLYVFKGKIWYVLTYDPPTNITKFELHNTDGTISGAKNFALKDTSIWLKDTRILGISDSVMYLNSNIISENKGIEFVKTDGTIEGTKIIKDINPNANSSIKYIYNNGSSLFFYADTFSTKNPTGNKNLLFISDGTPQGTIELNDTNAIKKAPNNSQSFYTYNGKTYFSRYYSKAPIGYKLMEFDGTTNGIKEVFNTPTSNFSTGFTKYMNSMYFMNGHDGHKIYKYDGINYKEIFKTGNFSETSTSIKSYILDGKLIYFYNDYSNSNTNKYYSDLIIIDSDTAYSMIKNLNIINVKDVQIFNNNLYVFAENVAFEADLYRLKFITNSKSIIIEKINAFPNPIFGNFITIDSKETGEINIYNSVGQIVLTQKIEFIGNQTISVEKLEVGTYFVQMVGKEKIYIGKIIKE